MTIPEFKDGFDILYNNVMSGKAPGLNEFDKSFFLTKAQDEILLNYFNPKSNKLQEGINDSIKREIDFFNITVEATISATLWPNAMYRNTLRYPIPANLLLPLSFYFKTMYIVIKPTSDSELQRLYSKPYKEPFKGQAYLIEEGGNAGANKYWNIIVRTNDFITLPSLDLTVRYIRLPAPIITIDLSNVEAEYNLPPNTLSIRGGLRNQSNCELHPIIHNQILDRAVELASIYFTNDRAQSMIAINQRGE